jgi:hypothetical protein
MEPLIEEIALKASRALNLPSNNRPLSIKLIHEARENDFKHFQSGMLGVSPSLPLLSLPALRNPLVPSAKLNTYNLIDPSRAFAIFLVFFCFFVSNANN